MRDKQNLPMPNGASVKRPPTRVAGSNGYGRSGMINAFETLSVMLSSLTLQHENLTKVWLPLLHPNMIQPTGKDHVRNISRHFRKHL